MRDHVKVARLDSPTSEAFVRASYAIIPLGVAGVALGVGEAVGGYPLVGAIVAVLGGAAAMLAVAKLRALKRWPFGSRDEEAS
jgi:hypothetical protein